MSKSSTFIPITSKNMLVHILRIHRAVRREQNLLTLNENRAISLFINDIEAVGLLVTKEQFNDLNNT